MSPRRRARRRERRVAGCLASHDVLLNGERQLVLWFWRPTCPRALRRMGSGRREPVLEVIHAKVNEAGELVASGGPSCVECSKLMLTAGVRRIYLYQERADGPGRLPPWWVGYDALDFHEHTLAALGLPGGRGVVGVACVVPERP